MSNSNLTKLVNLVEKKYIRTDLPDFRPGDTVIVNVIVTEVNRTRTQAFEGVVIGKTNRGVNSSFMVRKISYGEGVERTFQTHSPVIKDIKIVQRGHVRQAKLYYLRGLSGKAARIKQKLTNKSVVVPTTGSAEDNAND